ncbi:MAG: flagellar biosynthesis protein FlhA [Phycisphaerales bacterium]
MAQPALLQSTNPWRRALTRAGGLITPVAFVCMLLVIVVPLPTFAIDMLIAFNLSLSAIILLTTVYIERPLDFSVFPALLLGVTLYRLCLNIATTRLILTADASTPSEAVGAAGRVIAAFGEFVAGNNPIVGAVIFCILVIVQFVVITKGSTRISEVAARFTLDAMPGKQMAIDADLTAGIIDEDEARQRRQDITREADFYGAMDGASKFVRGDAIAGIIITVVNIIGGFAIGLLDRGWSAGETLQVFTRLTIGDGLVSQIPSFIIAIASGLTVARGGSEDDLNQDLARQLTGQPRALFITAVFLVVMAFTGMPFVPMLLCAAVITLMGTLVHRGVQAAKTQKIEEASAKHASQAAEPPEIDSLLKIDLLELEVGYGLVKIVNRAEGGDLLDRISAIRRQLAVELGLVLPPVRIRDNSQVDQHAYRIKIRGAEIAEGEVHPGMWLAMDSGATTGKLDGIQTREPAFGLDAWWIGDHLRSRADSMGYTVVDATSVLITHFTEVVKAHAEELITREEVNNLIANLKDRAPKLVEETIPSTVKVSDLQKVLQALLRERVPIRDLEIIVETLGDWSSQTKDIDILVEYVRNALKRTIAGQYATVDSEGQKKLYCVTVDPNLEDVVASYVDRSGGGATISMPPSVANSISSSIAEALRPLLTAGRPPVVLTSPQIRGPLRRILEPMLPTAAVLGYNEAPQGLEVESVGLVRPPKETAATNAA